MNTKTIGVFFIALIIILILIFVFVPPNGKPVINAISTSSISTVATTTINSTTNSTGNHNTTTVTTTLGTSTSTSTIYQSCLSSASTVSIPNGDFGAGTYADWNTTGSGFGAVPANITKLNDDGAYYASPWNGLTGTYFATTYDQNGGAALQPGNLTSSQFQATEPYLNFQIISKYDQNLYVEILNGNQTIITVYYDTYTNAGNGTQSDFKDASIPLTTALCKDLKIKVVADVLTSSSTIYDYIAAGDFYLSKTAVQTPGIVASENYTS